MSAYRHCALENVIELDSVNWNRDMLRFMIIDVFFIKNLVRVFFCSRHMNHVIPSIDTWARAILSPNGILSFQV